MNGLRRILWRSYSTPHQETSKEFSEAIQELIRKSLESQTSAIVEKTLQSREWATAPVVLAAGKMAKPSWNRNGSENNSVVRIRWLNKEDRNLDIIVDGDDNKYTVEVKNVMYAIITGLHHNEKKIRIRSANDIVVKVSNGNFKANKESARFALIHAFSLTKSKYRMKVKVEKMEEESNLATNSRLISENDFFKEFSNSIEKMKEIGIK